MKLEEIEKLCAEATPAPWEVLSYSVPMGNGFYGVFTGANKKVNDDDAKFIAASRELMPKLCQRVRELEADNEALWEMIRGLKAAVELYKKDS